MSFILFITFLFIPQAYLTGQIELPRTNSVDTIIQHVGYSLLYDETHEQAKWVAYELTSTETQGKIKRSNYFQSDPLVESKSASSEDYKSSGYDRGHLAPAADMKWSSTAMSESFYMSNMCPQTPSFNRGIWKRLENQVRMWALECGSVFIVTAGVLSEDLPKIGVNDVSVPSYYYKVILDYTEPELKGIGFIIPNQKSSQPIESFAVSIDHVEQTTGIDFFYTVPDEVENELEASVDLDKWGFKPHGKEN
jgi:endonuclease G|tara:strand:+ start:917 stop:1669 length:753 start_codon:yes stop_codon:yes gene_type:complete